jgi:hypothetical protein
MAEAARAGGAVKDGYELFVRDRRKDAYRI